MKIQGDDVLFSNFTYSPDCYYFFYIGDLKAYTLNTFMEETFRKRVLDGQVRFVAIIPDVCLQYNYPNIIVINPVAQVDINRSQVLGDVSKGIVRTSCRISSSRFMRAVSKSKAIHRLIDMILENQNHLYISMYESAVEMTLDDRERVSILGPDKHIAKRYNNKIIQYRELRGIVPLIEGTTCRGLDRLLAESSAMRKKWSDGIFISADYSAAGANSAITYSDEDVKQRFTDDNCEYLITRYIPHDLDPTVLAVVANETEVYVAGIADQTIVDGNKFVGSHFPSQIAEEQATALRNYTVAVGRMLGRAGYRGIFGCDYLIDRKNEIYFLEINARKQGTTLEFCFTLEQTLPKGAATLPELEYYAVMENCFPANTVEMKDNSRGIHWGTYNHKVAAEQVTTGYIPQNVYEREAFYKVANQELLKDFVILEHLGTHLKVMPGTFLARVVSVAQSRDGVNEGLCQGIGFIEQTIQ